jgi:uncharacterized protein with PIN domain
MRGIMDVRFSADRNLGKLAKWLRIFGYDTLYDRGNADRNFLRKAWGEGRVALTRKRDLAGFSHTGRLVVVKADHIGGQLGEVLEALVLAPDPALKMTRCMNCNAPLDEAPKESVECLVPDYVYSTCTQFRRCPLCGRIFWPGTHPRHVEEYLMTRIPARRP